MGARTAPIPPPELDGTWPCSGAMTRGAPVLLPSPPWNGLNMAPLGGP